MSNRLWPLLCELYSSVVEPEPPRAVKKRGGSSSNFSSGLYLLKLICHFQYGKSKAKNSYLSVNKTGPGKFFQETKFVILLLELELELELSLD